MFEYWRRGEELSLKKFEDYHTPADLDRVVQIPFANPDAVVGALETGTADIVSPELNPMQIRQINNMSDVKLTKTFGVGFTFFGMNQRRLPWSDVAFRRALAHMLDVEMITDTVIEEYATPAGAGRVIAPASKFWHNPDLPKYEYDPEKARQILKDAGYTWDEDGKLHYPDNY